MTHYLWLGIAHILDWGGLDHLYFIVSFCLMYSIKDLRWIIGLVTAFTVGHSITLALAALGLFYLDPAFVELLIPVTILISCCVNFFQGFRGQSPAQGTWWLKYPLISFFGLIHGLGFSNFLSGMLFEGEDVVGPLLGFNLGIEIAQLLIVLLVLGTLTAVDRYTELGRQIRFLINGIIFLLVGAMIF